MRIALLTDGLWPMSIGGMQKHSYYLLVGLLKKELDMILFHPGPGSIIDELPVDLQTHLKEVIVPFPKTSSFPGAYLKASYLHSVGIAQKLKDYRGKVDFIYAQGFTAWKLCEMRSNGDTIAPIAVHFHGLEMFQSSRGMKQKLIQWMFKGPVSYNIRNADVVYSLGGKLTPILESIIPRERISEIPIAIDKEYVIKEKEKTDSSVVRFLFIGRYERRKGLIEMNRAMDEFGSEDSVEFHFVGPIPISKRSGSSLASYHGKVSDVKRLTEVIDMCDALSLPSLAEGMPNVILEAMARGLAIIASDVGAVSELVDNSNGILIEPGNHIALTKAMKKYVGLSSQEKRTLSQNSISKVKNSFVWEKVIDRTLSDISSRLNIEGN